MTQIARPAPRRLDAFELPSEPGNERLALARVAETVQGSACPTPGSRSSRPRWPRPP